MSGTAVLVIDMQLGVFLRKEYDGMAIYHEEQLLANVGAIIGKARRSGVPVIYIQHMYRDFPIMEKGRPMWNVHPAIAPLEGEAIVEKYHADAFFESRLEDVLRGLGVKRLVITGIQTAYCVDTTCRRAHSMGYDCIWAEDAHSTLDSDILPAAKIIAHHNQVIGSQFATLRTVAEIDF
jgi:nicotinamidase-related amidase